MLRSCLVSECAEWRDWMWKRLIVALSLCVYCISRMRFSDIGGMAEIDEQRMCIKFCVRLGKTGSENLKCWNRLLVIRA